jgi:hypothetical protein
MFEFSVQYVYAFTVSGAFKSGKVAGLSMMAALGLFQTAFVIATKSHFTITLWSVF